MFTYVGILGAAIAFMTVIALDLRYPRRVLVEGQREIAFTSSWGALLATAVERALFRTGLTIGAALYGITATAQAAVARSTPDRLLAAGAALASLALLGVAWIPHDGPRWRGPVHAVSAVAFFTCSVLVAVASLAFAPSLVLALLVLALAPGLVAIARESLAALPAGVGLGFYYRASRHNRRLRQVETPLSLVVAAIWFAIAWPAG